MALIREPGIALVIVAKEPNPEVLNFLVREFSGSKICLVTPDLKEINFREIEVIADQDILKREYVQRLLPLTGERLGWYYQQFLKYSIIKDFPQDHIHIIDGDSVCGQELSREGILCRTSRSINPIYSGFNARLCKMRETKSHGNFISNQMVFQTEILNKMLCQIEENYSDDWIVTISKHIDQKQGSGFSEYQLYAEYALANTYAYVRDVKVFRRLDLVGKNFDQALKKYDVVATEGHHRRDFFRKFGAKCLYSLGIDLP